MQFHPSLIAVEAQENLVPLDGLKSLLLYDIQGLHGSIKRPFLARGAAERLYYAQAALAEYAAMAGKEVELLIWDVYRTRETQKAIYDLYVEDLMLQRKLAYDEAFEQARYFVASPSGIFPHGTGGAVDLTLLIDGEPAPMGTDFDAFVAESGRDWYRNNPPTTDAQRQCAENRELLRSVMESAGFVGVSSEWWHYEWGTSRWAAQQNNGEAILTRIHHPPIPPTP